MNIKDWTVLLIPILSGYATAQVCPMDRSDGENLKARPPAWVFSVVWPILYLLLGYSWMILRKKTYLADWVFGANVFFLILWLIFYGCMDDKKGGLWILVVLIMVSLMAFALSIKYGDSWISLLLTPYVMWILFATMLNYSIVDKMK